MKTLQPKSHEDFVETQAARHTSETHEYPISPWHRFIFSEFKSYLASPVLDIGTRNGLVLDELEKLGYEAWGVEITDIAKWAQVNKRKVIQCDIQERTLFKDKFFKSVVITACIEHLYKPVEALNEIKRILDGHILIVFPVQGLSEVRDAHYTCWSTIKEMTDWLEENGLEIIYSKSESVVENVIIAKVK